VFIAVSRGNLQQIALWESQEKSHGSGSVWFGTDGVYGKQGESPGIGFEITFLNNCYPEQARRENKATLEEGRLSLGKPGTCLFNTAPTSYRSAGC